MPEGLEFLKVGAFLRFVGSDVPESKENRYYQVKAKEPFQYETGREDETIFSSVASGGNSGFKNVAIMEPDDSPLHLLAADWGLEDGCRYYMRIPTGTSRLGLDMDQDIGYVTADMSHRQRLNPTYGFYLVEEMYPAFDVYNETPHAVTPKIWFFGFLFEIKEVTDEIVTSRMDRFMKGLGGGQPFTFVTLGGMP